MTNQKPDLTRLVADVVASYVSNNKVDMNELPALVQQVYHSFLRLDGITNTSIATEGRPEPAVPVKKSITPEYIVCLEDGKKLKMLKRHLKTAYNMSPQQYRERWNLPSDYPMVAPSYAKERSTLAKNIGLGTKANQKS
ncbi:MAG: MucR family transcriptional regulator [Alphaproteobacteria bacterium]|nr:MucR family transcriptional regulator [Alphaproteobacteria bacterium]